MTKHFSLFIEVSRDTTRSLQNLKKLHVFSDVPLQDLGRHPLQTLKVARWEGEGFEVYGDISQNHRGLFTAPLLHTWNGWGPAALHEAIFFPFIAQEHYPRILDAISEIRSNPRLDQLNISETGNEITLHRLHAYHPRQPQEIHYRVVKGDVSQLRGLAP